MYAKGSTIQEFPQDRDLKLTKSITMNNLLLLLHIIYCFHLELLIYLFACCISIWVCLVHRNNSCRNHQPCSSLVAAELH